MRKYVKIICENTALAHYRASVGLFGVQNVYCVASKLGVPSNVALIQMKDLAKQ